MTVERIPDDTLIERIPWPKYQAAKIIGNCRIHKIKTAGELREHAGVIGREYNIGYRTVKTINDMLGLGAIEAVAIKNLIHTLDCFGKKYGWPLLDRTLDTYRRSDK